MRLLIVANSRKEAVGRAVADVRTWLEQRGRGELLGVNAEQDGDLSKLEADCILVMGGDGTLLSVMRRLGGRAIPVMGVNFGRLGFLASFTPDNYRAHLETLLTHGMDALPARRRMMIEASVLGADERCGGADHRDVAARRRFVATALNDAVITAGSPFRMIDMDISADDAAGVRCDGDGIIIATPSGSTAYNVSAGGPIINPDVDCLCITPICAHSLSFRPVVISDRSTVVVKLARSNEGTTLHCDGQESVRLSQGESVVVRRRPDDALLIENPDARGWSSLAEKLKWAVSPRRGI